MKLGFNGATTMRASLLEDVRVCREVGFEYFELRDNKLKDLLRTRSLNEIRAFIEDFAVQPIAMNSLEKATLRNREEFCEVLDRARTLCEYSSTLGCPLLIVVPSFLETSSLWPSREEVKRDACSTLYKLEEVARPYGVKIAFEFLGFANSSVNTLSFCHEIVEELNNPNIGITIDAFHFFLSNESLSVLDTIDPKRIFLIHIADAEDVPRSQLTDAHRTIPGDGVIPLKSFVRKLQEIGYQGVFSIELFNPKYWGQDPRKVASLCYQRMKELFSDLEGGIPCSV